MSTHMQYGWLANVMSVDEGQRVRVQRRHRANALQQRDETMPRLYGGTEELQAIGVR